MTDTDQTIDVGGVTLGPGCNNNTFNVTNEASVLFGCKTRQDMAIKQQISQALDVTTTAGLWGLAVTSTNQQATSIIQTYMSSKCQTSTDVKQVIHIGGIACNGASNNVLNFMNKFGAVVTCKLAQAEDISQTADQIAKVVTSAWDPFGSLMLIMIILIVCVGGFGVGAKMLKPKVGGKK